MVVVVVEVRCAGRVSDAPEFEVYWGARPKKILRARLLDYPRHSIKLWGNIRSACVRDQFLNLNSNVFHNSYRLLRSNDHLSLSVKTGIRRGLIDGAIEEAVHESVGP